MRIANRRHRMKSILKKLVVTTTIAFFGTFSAGISLNAINYVDAADFSKLVILHTNDTHGFDRTDPKNKINGLAVLAQLKKDLAAKGYDVVLLDAGDCSQDNNLVNFSKGRAAFEFFNAVGYSAGCLGNHEFDYGQQILARNIRVANYPVISSNIIVNATGKTLRPASTIIKAGDLRLGVIGFTTPETVTSTRAKNVAGLTFLQKENLYQAAREQVAAMKAAGCDLIIGLGHMGSGAYAVGNRSDDILLNVDGFDIFVDGHDHVVKNRLVNNALLVEVGAHNQNFGMVHYVNGKWQEDMVPYGTLTREDPEVKKVIDKEAAHIQSVLGAVAAKSTFLLDGTRDPGVRTYETNLADLVADAFLWEARQSLADEHINVDAAVVNGGSVRKSIQAGDITLLDISEVEPFNNTLYAIKISGAKLLEIMEAGTCILPKAIPGLPQVAGIKYTVDTRVPYELGKKYPNSLYYAPAKPGSRVTIHEVNGKPFDLKAEYTIVVTDFIVTSGDSYSGLGEAGAIRAKWPLGCTDSQALQDYVQNHLKGVIGDQYKEAQGRITIIK